MAIPVDIYTYCTSNRRSPVYEWLQKLPDAQRKECLAVLEILEDQGPATPWPVSKPLKNGLHELRTNDGRIQLRMLYFFRKGAIAVVAAAFTKSAPQLVDSAMRLAQRRRAEVEADFEAHTMRFNRAELEAQRRRNP